MDGAREFISILNKVIYLKKTNSSSLILWIISVPSFLHFSILKRNIRVIPTLPAIYHLEWISLKMRSWPSPWLDFQLQAAPTRPFRQSKTGSASSYLDIVAEYRNVYSLCTFSLNAPRRGSRHWFVLKSQWCIPDIVETKSKGILVSWRFNHLNLKVFIGRCILTNLLKLRAS